MRMLPSCMIALQTSLLAATTAFAADHAVDNSAPATELTAPAYAKNLHVPAHATREFRLRHIHPGAEFVFIESSDGTPLQGTLELNDIQWPQMIKRWQMDGQSDTAGVFTMLRTISRGESWHDFRLIAGDKPLNVNLEYMVNPPPGYVGAKLENGELQSMNYANNRSTWLDVEAPAGARVTFKMWDGEPASMRVYDTQPGDGGWRRLTECDRKLNPGTSCAFTARSGKARIYVYGVDRSAHVSASW